MAKKDVKKEEITENEDKVITDEEIVLTKEEELELQVKALEEKVRQLQNQYLKEKADVENVKKRLEKERVLERKYAAFSVVKKLVNPLDNFELALNVQVDDEQVMNFVKGFKMIQDQIKKGLEEEGVSEIDALNEEYDPNFHQAIMTEKKEGVDSNIVIEVLQKGYMFKDRVIRPAMVKISE